MLNIFKNFRKFSFLLSQLVIRDFKVKYKRSFLGVLWSLLNPLLMMLVMYMVFSQVFRFDMGDINYPLYLFTGLIIFNYFSEASNMAMGSIVNNFSLITKVYMPKYIFPLSKALFSGINFLLSLIPLYLIIFIVRQPMSPAHLLLPFVFLCIFLFTLGVGMFMASLAVFFRDMFYIYTIVLTVWMYMTPIFYPIKQIENGTILLILKCNPLYHFVSFMRTIIIYNRVPALEQFGICFAFAVGAFLVGAVFFRLKQDRFIYYI